MAKVTVGQENTDDIEIYYEDHGTGQPVVLIHGDADRILPYASTAARLPGLIKDLTFVTVEGGPHNIAWTFPDVVNPALLAFLGK
jgi:non-heme chloroperoxidase